METKYYDDIVGTEVKGRIRFLLGLVRLDCGHTEN